MSTSLRDPEPRHLAPRAGAPGIPVSVIVPCYRCSKTIRRALASVAAQTARPQQLVLVDDASGDGTLALLQEIRDELGSNWVRVIALAANAGPSVARNMGWDVASGEYVAFLDADDAWHPEKLERQYKVMKARPDVALSGHAARQLKPEDSIRDSAVEAGYARVSRTGLLLSNPFITPSVMVRRGVPYRFNPHRRHMEDHLLWMQMACANLGIIRLHAALAYTFKAPFGDHGLSGQTLAMERGELANYHQLHREDRIGGVVLVILLAFSCLKYARRLIVLTLHPRGRGACTPLRDFLLAQLQRLKRR